ASNLREHFYGFAYAWCRQYDRALEIYNQFPIKRNFFYNEQHAQAYLAIGDYTNAMRLGKEAALARGESPDQVNKEFDALSKAFKQEGPRKYWELNLEFETPKQDEGHLMRMAAILTRLGQPDQAFHYLR